MIGSSLEDALTAAITGAEARLGAGDDLREALIWIVQAWIDGMTGPGSRRDRSPANTVWNGLLEADVIVRAKWLSM